MLLMPYRSNQTHRFSRPVLSESRASPFLKEEESGKGGEGDGMTTPTVNCSMIMCEDLVVAVYHFDMWRSVKLPNSRRQS